MARKTTKKGSKKRGCLQMADITAAKQNLEKTLSSVGINVTPGDDVSLRAGVLTMIQNLNLAFGDGSKPDQYTPETAQAIQDKITEHFNTPISGVTRLEEFKAAVAKDADFLVKDLKAPSWYVFGDKNDFRKDAKEKINGIYAQNLNNISRAFFEIMRLSENDDTKSLVRKIADNTDLLSLDNIHDSVALIENSQTFFGNLGTLNDNAFFDVAVDPKDLEKLKTKMTPQEEVALVEATIGIANPDGEWGDAERAALKAYVGKLQSDPYFGKGLRLEDKLDLPDNLRTLAVFDAGWSPKTGDVDADWKPQDVGGALGLQAYDDEQDGVWDFGFKLHFMQRVTLLGQSGTIHDEYNKSGMVFDEFKDVGTVRDAYKNSGTVRDEHKDSGTVREEYRISDTDRAEENGFTLKGYQQHFRFAQALENMESRGVQLLSKEDQLSPGQAARKVEEVLREFAPMLNDTLEDAQKKAEAAGRSFEANGLAALFDSKKGQEFGIEDFFAGKVAGDFLDLRIVEIKDADTKFDFKSQAALQGLMQVLSSEYVLGIQSPKGEEFFYTADKGIAMKAKLAAALDKENKDPPQFIKKMDEKQLDMLRAMLENGQFDTLISSLNVLSKNGRLINYNITDKKGFAPLTQDIVKDEIRRLEEANNPDAVKLFDTLLYSYTNGQFGINNVLDGASLRKGEDETLLDRGREPARDDEGHEEDDQKFSAKQKYAQRLAQYFESTKKALSGDAALDDAFFLTMMQSFRTLPLGNDTQRDLFQQHMVNAFRDSKDGAEFAEAVDKAMESIRERHGDVTLADRHFVRPTAHPKLANFEPFTSGGQSMDANDVIHAYNDLHLGKATGDMRARGQEAPLHMHTYLSFQDDDGQVYVAGIDKGAMIFTIEKVDAEQLAMIDQYLHNDEIDGKKMAYENRLAYLQDNSPVFALIFPDGYGDLSMVSYSRFHQHLSDISGGQGSVRKFADIKAEYADMAQEVRDNAIRRIGEPLLASGTARDAQKAAREFAAAVAKDAPPQPPEQDRVEMSHFANALRYKGQILDYDKLTLLDQYRGQDNFMVGLNGHQDIRLKGVNIAENPDNADMFAYYNPKTQTIDVLPYNDMFAPHTDDQGRINIFAVQNYLEHARQNNIKHVFTSAADQDTPEAKTGMGKVFTDSHDGKAKAPETEISAPKSDGASGAFNKPDADGKAPPPQKPVTPQEDTTPDPIKQ
jgi:hypothetical protein